MMRSHPQTIRRPTVRRRRRRVGILGGSFNPAHEGHLHVSHVALRRLGLDEVWWLVSPQNPLKTAKGMAPYRERLARAQTIADDPRIRISDFEARAGTRYTIDTLRALKRRYRSVAFVWLMGADNLATFHCWKSWSSIPRLMPVAIFDRPGYSLSALSGRFASRFRRRRQMERKAKLLMELGLPAWTFIHCPKRRASATAIRGNVK